MEYYNVKDILDHICLTFGKSLAKDSKVDFLRDELNDINVNETAVEHIKRYFSGLDSCPTNLTKAIRAAYFQWQQAQPESANISKCNTCNGYGLLIREERNTVDGQLYAYTSRCPHCENWKQHTSLQTPVADMNKYKPVNVALPKN